MESGDSSEEEAPLSNPTRKDLMRKEWSKAVSMLVAMKTEDGLGVLSLSSPRNLAWHAAQSIVYGREQKAHVSCL